MSQFETLIVDTDARGVCTLTLNTPETRNALSARMIAELTEFAETTDARVVILRGTGKVFCAGGDLNWMKAQIEADRDTRMAEARKLADMLRALNEMPVPMIGCLHGGAFGGGVGLACVCDVAIATDDTRFGLTETRLGLIPATIGPYVVARMGEGRARRVFMSSRIFAADEALSFGIISKAVPSAELEASVEREVAPYLSVAPGAVGRAKALARHLGPRIDDQVIDETITRLADAWETDEARAGIDAFLNKTPAPWVRGS